MALIQKSVLLITFIALTQACNGIKEPEQQRAAIVGDPAPEMEKRTPISGFTGENVRLIGRFDLTENGQAQFTWPGSTLEFRFEGTAASIEIASSDRVRFSVDVDGVETDLWVDSGKRVYPIASELDAGTHRVKVSRLSESFVGVTAFTSDPIIQGKLLASSAPSRRLLVFGDSITAGYGVEGDSEACGYSPETSNPLKTYASLAAETVNADLQIIAWSGIGAWRSYGEKTPKNPTIIDRYSLTLADDFDSDWSAPKFAPDAVLVTIGTNDYWDGEGAQYQEAMEEFLQQLKKSYSGKPIYLVVSPMLTGAVREQQKTVLSSLAKKKENITVLDLGRIEPSDGYGCDYHPNIKTQSRMATALVDTLKADLDW